jgi:hypothetical protein
MTTFVTNEFHAKPGRGSDVLALLLAALLDDDVVLGFGRID